VEGALELCASPGAGGIPGAKQLRAAPVDVGEDVESPFMITKARRPDALSISLLPIFQPELRSEV
jgi:hypothetical protein